MKTQNNKPVVLWLLTGSLIIFLIVIIGGITRLTNSGLSMVDWEPIMGFIPPINELEWAEVFEKYKLYPEYQMVNFHFTLEEFKSIFFWEYLHRLLGRILGLVFIVPFIIFLIQKRLSKKTILNSLVVFFMGGTQGFLGWWMVKSGLVDNPDVSHYRLAMHLIMAFLTFSYTFWVALNLIYENEEKFNNQAKQRELNKWIYSIVIVTIIQIVYGAFVAGLNAGFILNTFPKMGDNWIDDSVFALSPLWLNFIEGLGGVQFIHRYLAYLVVGLVVFFVLKCRNFSLTPRQKTAKNSMLLMVIIQFLLGVFTLLMSVPVWLGVIHQLGAFLLLTTIVYSLHAFKTSK